MAHLVAEILAPVRYVGILGGEFLPRPLPVPGTLLSPRHRAVQPPAYLLLRPIPPDILGFRIVRCSAIGIHAEIAERHVYPHYPELVQWSAVDVLTGLDIREDGDVERTVLGSLDAHATDFPYARSVEVDLHEPYLGEFDAGAIEPYGIILIVSLVYVFGFSLLVEGRESDLLPLAFPLPPVEEVLEGGLEVDLGIRQGEGIHVVEEGRGGFEERYFPQFGWRSLLAVVLPLLVLVLVVTEQSVVNIPDAPGGSPYCVRLFPRRVYPISECPHDYK